jgi:hypothetical protein
MQMPGTESMPTISAILTSVSGMVHEKYSLKVTTKPHFLGCKKFK